MFAPTPRTFVLQFSPVLQSEPACRLRCLSIMCCIFSPSSTWKGYFVLTCKSGRRCDFSPRNSRRFPYKLNFKGCSFQIPQKKLHFAIRMNISWITVLSTYTLVILIGVNKEREYKFTFHQIRCDLSSSIVAKLHHDVILQGLPKQPLLYNHHFLVTPRCPLWKGFIVCY